MQLEKAVLETKRLALRKLTAGDAEFILALVNDPAWLRFIGDRGVRTPDDARKYIVNGPAEMYDRLGFGLYLVELKADSTPIGICGLIKRDTLADVDIGFAFLPGFRGQGYGHESATAVMAYGRDTLGLERIAAIVSPENDASIRLLERAGMAFERTLRLTEDDPEVRLYARQL